MAPNSNSGGGSASTSSPAEPSHNDPSLVCAIVFEDAPVIRAALRHRAAGLPWAEFSLATVRRTLRAEVSAEPPVAGAADSDQPSVFELSADPHDHPTNPLPELFHNGVRIDFANEPGNTMIRGYPRDMDEVCAFFDRAGIRVQRLTRSEPPSIMARLFFVAALIGVVAAVWSSGPHQLSSPKGWGLPLPEGIPLWGLAAGAAVAGWLLACTVALLKLGYYQLRSGGSLEAVSFAPESRARPHLESDR
ncbi:hypothetical protein H696_01070 [Fonticula alba]|uniref:Uncharacterized protein n=1 Tax=Fonticula alba TaxID=691883 RepID=A0A058ZCI5_FONAL|nr:hypothetical protein H696_01070 [Fonticula alba]KCV71651.1 hypothetical protein H696_01070 [Fonticula alba]|eukprot:XP_009493229.1 hypothetical protein H696_01070 [Fonticula alba]